ncbi:MAG TPA: hypothetical protein PLZ56_11525 [Anaerolineae bacterium]|nr:hypothetical protein [Anaerolineae bacterium]
MTTLVHYDVYYCTSWSDAHSGSNSYTQLNGTGQGAGSAFTRKVDWIPGGALSFPVDAPPVGTRSGGLQSTTTTYADSRSGVLRITSTYTGADTGADRRAEMQDEWATLVSTITPAAGEILLRLDRPNRSATTLSRLLVCRVSSIPEWRALSDRADSDTLILEIGLEVLYPYYLTRTATSTAYAGVGTSFSSATIANGGHTDGLGLTVLITAKTGSPTLVTLENTTTGQTLAWTIATAATANDRLSWFCDDPRKVKLTTATASHLGTTTAGQNPALARGNNTVKLKVNSGTIDATVYTADEFYTL